MKNGVINSGRKKLKMRNFKNKRRWKSVIFHKVDHFRNGPIDCLTIVEDKKAAHT